MPGVPYVLVTPARNEAEFIEVTLRSVVAQTVRPARWIIVSDGSTDDTEKIVSGYAAEHEWIELVRIPERRERNFAAKVHAFNAGYATLHDVEYEFIGSLDADVSFDNEYFSYLLGRLAQDESLGLVGTPFLDSGKTYDYRFTSIEHVSGACQLFRRKCFEAIGGYLPIKGGGIDLIAVLMSRMKGWKTRTFTEKVCVHHRRLGTGQGSKLSTCFNYGVKDYTLGCHPLWEAFRTFYQMTRKPYVIGGLLVGIGYGWSLMRGLERTIARDLMAFRRREQIQRLRNLCRAERILPDQAPPLLGTARQVAREPDTHVTRIL
jgi:poly-beta-1,6-N-acetyl-D-glucosamine synthase